MKHDPYCLGDRFSAHGGMKVIKLGPSYAEAEVTIEDYHLNSIDIPHGGVYFFLADLAFGAANNYLENSMVTLDSTIEFIASAKLGDVVTAYCKEVSSTRRIKRHRIEVRDQDGKLLTVINCTGYAKKPTS